MKNTKILILLSWITILLGLVSCTPKQEKPIALTLSAGGTFRDVLAEVDKLYKREKPHVTITYNIAPSETQKALIEQGVSVDIFLTANSKIIEDLKKQGFVISATDQKLTKNSLVLITQKESSLPIANFQDLTSEKVKKVALGTDKIAVGIYTKEALNSLNIYTQVQKKGVFAGEDIREILKAVETKKVDVGITYATEAKLSKNVKVVAVAPENSYTPAVSQIAVLKRSQNVTEAQEFIKFLKSEQAVTVFEKYGFTVIK